MYPRNESWLTQIMWPRRHVKASLTNLRLRWRHGLHHVMTVGPMCMRARMAVSLYVYKRWSGGWRPVSHSFLQLLARISASVGRRQLNNWTQWESSSDSEFLMQLPLTWNISDLQGAYYIFLRTLLPSGSMSWLFMWTFLALHGNKRPSQLIWLQPYDA